MGKLHYTYVSPRQYRWRYRSLAKWQQRWHRYERKHPCDTTGLPLDEHADRTISVGGTNKLEALIYQSHDGKVSEPVTGFVRYKGTKNLGGSHGSIRRLRVDESEITLFPDPLCWVCLSSRVKRILRMSCEKIEWLVMSDDRGQS